MPHLPQELLSQIISLALPPFPCQEHEDWLERQRDLSSFSLVHSSWTPIARDLRHIEDDVSARDCNFWGNSMRRLAVASSRTTTRSLVARGALNRILGANGTVLWRGVKNLVHVGEDVYVESLKDHAKFPQLTTLTVLDCDIYLDGLNSAVCFPFLRRLVLDDSIELDGEISAYQAAFSPLCMPHLSHLSLGASHKEGFPLDQLFAAILPQVKTLAISGRPTTMHGSPTFQTLHNLPNLSHLSMSLSMYETAHEYLFSLGPPALPLNSLHLDEDMLLDYPEMENQVASILREGKIKRVVVYGTYGSREDMADLIDLSEPG